MNNSSDVPMLLQIGRIRLRDKMFSEAQSYFEKVLETEPKNIDALNGLGLALLGLSWPERAISVFKKVLELGPEKPALILANLATAHELACKPPDRFFVEALKKHILGEVQGEVLELIPKEAGDPPEIPGQFDP